VCVCGKTSLRLSAQEIIRKTFSESILFETDDIKKLRTFEHLCIDERNGTKKKDASRIANLMSRHIFNIIFNA
jgi:hypothetical protein